MNEEYTQATETTEQDTSIPVYAYTYVSEDGNQTPLHTSDIFSESVDTAPSPRKSVGLLMLLAPLISLGLAFGAAFFIVAFKAEFWSYGVGALILNVVTTTICAILIPACIHICYKKQSYERYNLLPIKANMIFPMILLGIGLVFLASSLNYVLTSLYEYIGADLSQLSGDLLDGVNLADPVEFTIAVLCVCVLPAIAEELLCRGAVLYSLRSKGLHAAAIISGLYFALLHETFISLPVYILLGYIFGVVAYKTRSVWTSTLLHFVYNLTILLLSMPSVTDTGAVEQTSPAFYSIAFWVSVMEALGVALLFLIPAFIMFFCFCAKNDKKAAAKVGKDVDIYLDEYNGSYRTQVPLGKGCIIAIMIVLFVISLLELPLVFGTI